MDRFLFDSFESRKLLSAAVLHVGDIQPTGAQIIAADEAEYQSALNQSTAGTNVAQLQDAADANAIKTVKADTINGSAQKAKLKADTAAQPVTLANDQA